MKRVKVIRTEKKTGAYVSDLTGFMQPDAAHRMAERMNALLAADAPYKYAVRDSEDV